jgi:hypothetical protein
MNPRIFWPFFACFGMALIRHATCERLLHTSPPVSRTVLTAVLGCQLLYAATAHAQAAVEFIPSVSMFTVYDDNLFARVEGSAGQMLQVRPSFEGSYESPTVRMLGLYSFDMQRSNFATLNTLDARRHALGETRFRTSAFTTLNLGLRYDRSETPGDINMDTGLLGERRTAERLQVTPTFAHRVSPFTTITGGYDWTSEHQIDGEQGTMHTARGTWSRTVTSRSAVTASLVTRFFFDNLANHNSQSVLLGWDREMAPGTRLSVFGGPRITSYHGMAPEAGATFARNTNRIRLGLDYWHGETIVLGIQGPVAVDSVTTRLTNIVTRRVEVASHFGVSDVRTLDAREATIYRGTLGGSWSPGGIYTVSTTYAVDYQLGTIRSPIFLDGEAVGLEDKVLRHVFRVAITVAPRWKRSILPPEEAARAKGVSR